MSELSITTSQVQGKIAVTILHLNGHLHGSTEHELLDHVRQVREDGAQHLLLDLTSLEVLSSAGLRAIQNIFKLFTPDVVALHLDGLGRPRLRVTQDDTGDAAILAEARIYSEGGALAEVIEGQPLTAAALAPGAVVDLAADWPRSIRRTDALGRVVFPRDEDGRETAARFGPLWPLHRDHADLHPEPPYQDSPERITQDGLGRTVVREALLTGRTLRDIYTHDAAGRLTLHVDPAGHGTTWERDGAGRIVRALSPDAGEVRQRFDDVGRRVERQTATGARVTWTYDPLGRLLRERSFDPAGEQIGEVRHTFKWRQIHSRKIRRQHFRNPKCFWRFTTRRQSKQSQRNKSQKPNRLLRRRWRKRCTSVALSDVGIAMGGLGSDATIETADVVIQDDMPSKIPMAINIGKQTKKIVWQNITMAFVVKAIVLILGAGGLATMWEAVFADVGVALLAILNAVRIQRMKF